MSDARLRWRCRRGLKELDVLLEGYLERGYPTASAAERETFERLMEADDPELWRYFTEGAPAEDPELVRLVARIRGSAPPAP